MPLTKALSYLPMATSCLGQDQHHAILDHHHRLSIGGLGHAL